MKYRKPVVVVEGKISTGEVIYVKDIRGNIRLPRGEQKDDLNLLQMMYDVLIDQTGYFPIKGIEKIDVEVIESVSVVKFYCLGCVQLDNIDVNKTIDKIIFFDDKYLKVC